MIKSIGTPLFSRPKIMMGSKIPLSPPVGAMLHLPGIPPGGAYIKDWSFGPNAIDVGSPAIDRVGLIEGARTLIDKTNPSNFTGKINKIQIWAQETIGGMRVGTFYLVSGTTYACRDSTKIGAVTAGSVQTFSGMQLNVKVGDFIGCYF